MVGFFDILLLIRRTLLYAEFLNLQLSDRPCQHFTQSRLDIRQTPIKAGPSSGGAYFILASL
jgi:hypothetical protein